MLTHTHFIGCYSVLPSIVSFFFDFVHVRNCSVQGVIAITEFQIIIT